MIARGHVAGGTVGGWGRRPLASDLPVVRDVVITHFLLSIFAIVVLPHSTPMVTHLNRQISLNHNYTTNTCCQSNSESNIGLISNQGPEGQAEG